MASDAAMARGGRSCSLHEAIAIKMASILYFDHGSLITPMEMNPLRQALERVNPLPDEVWAEVAVLVSIRTVVPGEHLLRAGERATSISFLRRGLLREYYLDDAGHESTRRFCSEGEFSGSLADLLGDGAALASIEVIDASEVWILNWTQFDALTEKWPALMKLMRRFAEILYVRKMKREFEMLTLPAAERYRCFAHEFPALEARLPRHMIASYLGITPVHFSRICAAERQRPAQAELARRK